MSDIILKSLFAWLMLSLLFAILWSRLPRDPES